MGPLTDKNTDSRAKCTQWGKIQVNQFRFRHPWKKKKTKLPGSKEQWLNYGTVWYMEGKKREMC